MFDFTIYKDNSPNEFKQACKVLEQAYPTVEKDELLIDVDGTTIQLYYVKGKKIKFIDDYEVGAVYVESELDLSAIFN